MVGKQVRRQAELSAEFLWGPVAAAQLIDNAQSNNVTERSVSTCLTFEGTNHHDFTQSFLSKYFKESEANTA
jgi:hypothetical protein